MSSVSNSFALVLWDQWFSLRLALVISSSGSLAAIVVDKFVSEDQS